MNVSGVDDVTCWRSELVINNGVHPRRSAKQLWRRVASGSVDGGETKTRLISDAIDVILRAVVVFLFGKLEITHSFRRHIHQEELWIYKYPRTPDIVSASALLVSVIVAPFAVTVLGLWWSRDMRDFRAASWVWTGGLCLNGFVTSLLKISVGRPRPDFFYRCYPDGQIPANALLSNTSLLNISTCTGNLRDITEGFKSFPSGHASFAFVSFGFIAFYMGAKLRAFSGRTETWRQYLTLMPLLMATVVAVSRTCDYHHHWQDVTVGSLLGLCISYFVYRQYYPSLLAEDCARPFYRGGRRYHSAKRHWLQNSDVAAMLPKSQRSNLEQDTLHERELDARLVAARNEECQPLISAELAGNAEAAVLARNKWI